MIPRTLPSRRSPAGRAAHTHVALTPGLPAQRTSPTTVDRKLVHRTRDTDVLPTSWQRHSDTRFTVGVRWPVDHPFFVPVDGRYSSQLIHETIRQAGLLLSCAALGVPLDYHFIMWDLRHRTRPQHLWAGSSDAHVEVEVQVTDIRHRRAVPSDARLHMVMRRDGHVAAVGNIHYSLVSPAGYRRLRGNAEPVPPLPLSPAAAAAVPPVPPRSVGHGDVRNVVLSATGVSRRWRLRIDPGELPLFDHDNDHIPGMALLEAAHQAAYSVAGGGGSVPRSSRVRFERYAEFGTPVWIEARPHADDGRLLIVGEQGEQGLFSAWFDGAPPGAE